MSSTPTVVICPSDPLLDGLRLLSQPGLPRTYVPACYSRASPPTIEGFSFTAPVASPKHALQAVRFSALERRGWERRLWRRTHGRQRAVFETKTKSPVTCPRSPPLCLAGSRCLAVSSVASGLGPERPSQLSDVDVRLDDDHVAKTTPAGNDIRGTSSPLPLATSPKPPSHFYPPTRQCAAASRRQPTKGSRTKTRLSGEMGGEKPWRMSGRRVVGRARNQMLAQILIPLAGTFLAYLLFHLLQIVYGNLTSPLRRILSGPPNASYLWGNSKEMGSNPELAADWESIYGQNYIFRGLLSATTLYTSDLKALNHIIAQHRIYERSHVVRDFLRGFMGDGILSAAGDEHKRQRRILNPAFGTAQIRLLGDTFIEKAAQLRDLWAAEVAGEKNTGVVDVSEGLQKATLDVIGRAGFGHDFNALTEDPHAPADELSQAFTDLLHSPKSSFYAGMRILQSTVPILKLVPLPGGRLFDSARERMLCFGRRIVADSKASLRLDSDEGKFLGAAAGGRRRRDLLSTLLRANMDPSVAPGQRLSEAEVVAQIPAFVLAGHETTSTATAWALHALSTHPDVQRKLRAELSSLSSLDSTAGTPPLDALNALPYLEQVVREVLRVHSPAMFMERKAFADDVIPLASPVVGRDGRVYACLPCVSVFFFSFFRRQRQRQKLTRKNLKDSKGPEGPPAHLRCQQVCRDLGCRCARIPVCFLSLSISRFPFLLILNAQRPERWEHIPEATNGIPSVWAHQMTFLSGSHNCIGFRFALGEMKAFLFTLVRAFEFAPAPAVAEGSGGSRIGAVLGGTIQRPVLLGADGTGKGLSLILTPVVG
ncbi:hypothetical protein HMN09_00856100 [Mycena chlorophos]|uniref:Cytochrome P450 n=1 Tax=Mycena chlorophos TaxID=658473 RepID=A0A8H6SSC5_MYCCL|nr:hypothetical protein HMN09_00856100 [Mycena chlorophos]